MKTCKHCKIEKLLTEFPKRKSSKDGYRNECKCCQKKYNQKYYEKNIEIIKERSKKYVEDNKEHIKEYQKKYREENKEYLKEHYKVYIEANKEHYKKYQKQYREANREYRNEYERKRKETDPLFKMKHNLRSRTYYAFKNKGYSKNTKTQEMLGVDWEVAKQHIENKFSDGMNWDNQGEWHIDHNIPLASAKTEQELKQLCHYTNLRPLWAVDNISKGAKLNWIK
jgi:hypothetical protein